MTTATAPETVLETTPEAVVPAKAETPILSILALVSSLSAIVFGLIIPLSIVAIVLGFYGLKREPQARTMAIWSIVLGFLPIALGVLVVGLGIAIAIPFGLAAFYGGMF